MNFGLLLAIKIINNGFGKLMMLKLEKLLVYLLVIEVKPVRKLFGIPYLGYIDNVRLVILTLGKLIKVFYPPNVTERFTKTREQPI